VYRDANDHANDHANGPHAKHPRKWTMQNTLIIPINWNNHAKDHANGSNQANGHANQQIVQNGTQTGYAKGVLHGPCK
jgi:hypothetical protein